MEAERQALEHAKEAREQLQALDRSIPPSEKILAVEPTEHLAAQEESLSVAIPAT